jgi:chorismate synthase
LAFAISLIPSFSSRIGILSDMAANSFGSRFVVTSFGESHGTALGVVVDGCPAGIKWNQKLLINEMKRRRPGQSKLVSARKELDLPEILSGVYQDKTLGTPIAMLVRNIDQRSQDYVEIAEMNKLSRSNSQEVKSQRGESQAGKSRPGHADDLWLQKFSHSDLRGGGRSSGRETVSRVLAGAVAQMLNLSLVPKLRVLGFASCIGSIELSEDERDALNLRVKSIKFKSKQIDQIAARFPVAKKRVSIVERLLLDAKAEGHSYGGVAEIWIDCLPLGLGQPVFHKLKADLASAFMGVGAVVGVEIGEGFEAAKAEGSEFHSRVTVAAYGGVRGGISTGERIVIRVAFKPTSSVLEVAKKGRHDPCIVPRAIPVLEAMAHCVIADHLLWRRSDQID